MKDDETLLTFAAYREIGGLDGAIDKRAEAAVAPLGEAEQACLPRLLRQLAVPAREKDGAATLTIRPVPFDEAAPDEAIETSRQGTDRCAHPAVEREEGRRKRTARA